MSTLYGRRVLNDPEVRLSYLDPLVGISSPAETTVELDNTDGYLDTLDLRGTRLDLNAFEAFSGENVWQMTGLVTSQEMKIDRAILRVVAHDLADLQTVLPKRLVTAATFPNAHPSLGLGKPIPIVFGNAASTRKSSDAWEMAYVGENIGSNQYDYLVGEGTYTSLSVYRSWQQSIYLVPSSEYTVNTSAYPGFTVIRFALRQADFGGAMDRLFVAGNSVENGRNFARAIQSLLSNSTWGLGLTINTASFDTAAADLDSIGGLNCDGVIDEPRPALDWLNELCIVRGLYPELNSSNEWTLTVNKSQSSIKAILGHGMNQTAGGTVTFDGLTKVGLDQAVKSLVLDYRYDRFSKTYALATTARAPFAFGIEKRLASRFIRDTTTADKTADFIAKWLTWQGDKIACSGDMMSRLLRPGNLFQYQSTTPSFSRTFQVQGLRRTILKGVTALDGAGWDSSIFTYTPAALPAEPADTTETDTTRQTPTAASSLSIASSGIEADGQGGWSAYVVLQYTVPAETWAQTFVRYRRNGATNYQVAAVNQATGSNLQTKITGLITGLAYDYAISRVNAINPALAASDLTLTNQTAPADTTAPGAPTSLAIVDQHLKSITFSWTAPPDKDVAYYHWEIRTAASGGGSLVVEGNTEGNGTKVALTLDQIAYSTTRYLRVRGHDYSGNVGSYSSSLSFSFSQVVTGDVTDQHITTAKRQLLSSQSTTFDLAANSNVGHWFTVGENNLFMVRCRNNTAGTPYSAEMSDYVNGQLAVTVANFYSSSINFTVTIYYW